MDGLDSSGGAVQVSCKNIVGDGTVTIKVKPGNDKSYRNVTNGADVIDLTDPIAIIIEGGIKAVKAESSNPGDVFELEVLS